MVFKSNIKVQVSRGRSLLYDGFKSSLTFLPGSARCHALYEVSCSRGGIDLSIVPQTALICELGYLSWKDAQVTSLCLCLQRCY